MTVRKKIIAPFAMAFLCAMLCVPAFAGAEGVEGSVSLQIKAYATDEPVDGGTLAIYKVGDIAEAGDAFSYTEGFKGCDEAFLTQEGMEAAETAGTLAEWAEGTGTEPVACASVDSGGLAKFEGLSLGLYLVTQDEAAEGYNAINPFLVTVPVLEEGSWVYDVDATPKTSAVTTTDTEPPAEDIDEPPAEDIDEPPAEDITTPPAEETDTSSSGSSGSSAGGAKTGDMAPVAGLAVMALAASGLCITAARRRRAR